MQGDQASKAVDGKARRRPTWDDDSFAAEEGTARAASRVVSHLPGALDSRVCTIGTALEYDRRVGGHSSPASGAVSRFGRVFTLRIVFDTEALRPGLCQRFRWVVQLP